METSKLKRPSEQRTRDSAILAAPTSKRLDSHFRYSWLWKYSVHGPCAWPSSPFQTMRLAGLRKQRKWRSHRLSHTVLDTQRTGISSDYYLKHRQQRGRKLFMKVLGEESCLNRSNSSLVQRICLSYLWQWVMYMAVSSHKSLISFSLDSISCFLSSLMQRRAASAFTRTKSIFKLPSGSSARIFYDKKKNYMESMKRKQV